MSSTPKRSLETEAAKEEEWEVVSGAKSLPSEPKTPTENKEAEEKKDNLQTIENKIKDPAIEENVIQNKETGSEEVAETEPDDWYETIPKTPVNTPEITATPPTYPLNSRIAELKGPDVMELTPITEEIAEDQNPSPSAPEEQSAPADETHEETQVTDSNVLKKSMTVICYVLTRLTVFIIAFSILKWSVTKLCEKIKKIKQSRPETRQTVE